MTVTKFKGILNISFQLLFDKKCIEFLPHNRADLISALRTFVIIRVKFGNIQKINMYHFTHSFVMKIKHNLI